MMLKLIAAMLAALAVGAVQAQSVSSHSAAATGSMSVSGVVGNGFGYSSQQSGATAWNNSAAGAGVSGYSGAPTLGADGTANTGARSEGATSSYVQGINVGSAFGVSAAGGVQNGSANATAGGAYLSTTGIHAFGATSQADVASASGAANVNNGFAANGTQVGAWNESTGYSKQTGWFGNSTGASTNGGTSNLSGGFAWGAIGATGGVATQSGVAIGF